MKLLSFALLLVSCCFHSYAQEKLPCGTKPPSEKQINRINARMSAAPTTAKLSAVAVSDVAISAHILRRSDGTGGLTESELNDALATVNGYYANANLNFYLLGDVYYIDNDSFFDFDADDESMLGATHDVENTINIYFANSVVSGESPLCGYAYFSGGPDRILMDNSCTMNGSTLPHEIGHFFDLYHTHGTSNNGTTDELVDGSNCSMAGDNICDTPADPNLSGVVVSCVYTGTDLDANDEAYLPDVNNIMSYAPKACRTQFSTGQYSAMANTYASERNYLTSKTLAANFDVNHKTICTGGSVTFEDKSIAPGNWSWVFAGGTPATSDQQNPEVTYATAGTYSVTLTISNDGAESDVKTFTNYILVRDTNPVAEISAGFEFSENADYTIENEDNDDTFEISTAASSSGSRSMLMDFLNYNRIGEEDYLILDEIDLTGDNLFRLTFDRAYAYFDDEYRDSLVVVISEACTYDWQLHRAYSYEDLATADPHKNSFVPESAEWTSEQMIIAFDDSWEGAQLAFKTINGFGNNLYLDQIVLEPVDTDLVLQELVLGCSSGAADGQLEVLATGSGSLTYSLDGAVYQSETIFESLEVGDYTLFTNQDGQLVRQDEFTIVSATSIDVQISADESSDLTAVADAVDYQWFYNNEEVVDGTSSTLDFQGGGMYFVVVTNAAGCSAKSDDFVITGFDRQDRQWSVFPNPVINEINISGFDRQLVSYEVVDLSGKAVLSGVLDHSQHGVIVTETIKSGIYLLNINTEIGQVTSKFRKL